MNQSTDNMATVKEGIFEIGDTPVYFIEYLTEGGMYDSVTVYKAQDTGNGGVGKKQKKKIVEPPEGGSSILSRLLGGRPPGKQKVVYEDEDPLFVAPVIEGTNSFKGADELGFYDREPDSIRYTGDPNDPSIKKPTVVEGKRTGIFIGLSSIKWVREYIPSKEVLNRYLAEQQLWSESIGTEFGTRD